MSIKLGDYFKDTSNVFTEEEALGIFKRAGCVDLEEKKMDKRAADIQQAFRRLRLAETVEDFNEM